MSPGFAPPAFERAAKSVTQLRLMERHAPQGGWARDDEGQRRHAAPSLLRIPLRHAAKRPALFFLVAMCLLTILGQLVPPVAAAAAAAASDPASPPQRQEQRRSRRPGGGDGEDRVDYDDSYDDVAPRAGGEGERDTH